MLPIYDIHTAQLYKTQNYVKYNRAALYIHMYALKRKPKVAAMLIACVIQRIFSYKKCPQSLSIFLCCIYF